MAPFSLLHCITFSLLWSFINFVTIVYYILRKMYIDILHKMLGFLLYILHKMHEGTINE
nr:MAG TPA: hypothetical protein [Inoviridae sp.]